MYIWITNLTMDICTKNEWYDTVMSYAQVNTLTENRICGAWRQGGGARGAFRRRAFLERPRRRQGGGAILDAELWAPRRRRQTLFSRAPKAEAQRHAQL